MRNGGSKQSGQSNASRFTETQKATRQMQQGLGFHQAARLKAALPVIAQVFAAGETLLADPLSPSACPRCLLPTLTACCKG